MTPGNITKGSVTRTCEYDQIALPGLSGNEKLIRKVHINGPFAMFEDGGGTELIESWKKSTAAETGKIMLEALVSDINSLQQLFG